MKVNPKNYAPMIQFVINLLFLNNSVWSSELCGPMRVVKSLFPFFIYYFYNVTNFTAVSVAN